MHRKKKICREFNYAKKSDVLGLIPQTRPPPVAKTAQLNACRRGFQVALLGSF